MRQGYAAAAEEEQLRLRPRILCAAGAAFQWLCCSTGPV